MKINTLFNIGDTAFLLENGECYKCQILDIDVEVEKTDEGIQVDICYSVNKEVSKGLLKTETYETVKQEDELYISKGAAREAFEALEKAEEHLKKAAGKLDEVVKKHPWTQKIPKYAPKGMSGFSVPRLQKDLETLRNIYS